MKKMLRRVMKRAWELKKEDERNLFSCCLKMAWKEVKYTSCFKRLKKAFAKFEERNNGFVVGHKTWKLNGMERTYYFAACGKEKVSFGYYDEINREYVPQDKFATTVVDLIAEY